jgi:large subunit ribosomal protein L22
MARANSNEAIARLTFTRIAPNKARIVLDQIRGLPAEEAQRVLQFSRKSASIEIGKVLNAAIANAGKVLNADADELYVTRCWADEGMTLKRFSPRAQGRAYRIRKRMSHITVCVGKEG